MIIEKKIKPKIINNKHLTRQTLEMILEKWHMQCVKENGKKLLNLTE